MDRFECDNVGEMKDFVGCKIERKVSNNSFILTQPVIIRSFQGQIRSDEQDI